jgi:hypothetical protein
MNEDLQRPLYPLGRIPSRLFRARRTPGYVVERSASAAECWTSRQLPCDLLR